MKTWSTMESSYKYIRLYKEERKEERKKERERGEGGPTFEPEFEKVVRFQPSNL